MCGVICVLYVTYHIHVLLTNIYCQVYKCFTAHITLQWLWVQRGSVALLSSEIVDKKKFELAGCLDKEKFVAPTSGIVSRYRYIDC